MTNIKWENVLDDSVEVEVLNGLSDLPVLDMIHSFGVRRKKKLALAELNDPSVRLVGFLYSRVQYAQSSRGSHIIRHAYS